jgi:hypothetical protein
VKYFVLLRWNSSQTSIHAGVMRERIADAQVWRGSHHDGAESGCRPAARIANASIGVVCRPCITGSGLSRGGLRLPQRAQSSGKMTKGWMRGARPPMGR